MIIVEHFYKIPGHLQEMFLAIVKRFYKQSQVMRFQAIFKRFYKGSEERGSRPLSRVFTRGRK